MKTSFYAKVLLLLVLLAFVCPMLRFCNIHTIESVTLNRIMVATFVFCENSTSKNVRTSAECIRDLSNKMTAPSFADLKSQNTESLKGVSCSTLFKIAYTNESPVPITDAEKRDIAAIAQLEVMGKYGTVEQFENPSLKYYELLAVAQIIRNRLKDIRFPNTVSEIIYSATQTDNKMVYQFSTSPYIQDIIPSEYAYAAVDEVFDNGVTVLPENYLYFCASWYTTVFESNNYSVIKFIDKIKDFDKIIADATAFYAGV